MQNEIIINANPGETRVALLERSVFTELHIERDEGKSVMGNIVKGRVSRVLPGMQAAFVDIGLDKAAFLYVGDYFPTDDGNADRPSPRGRRNGGRSQPPKIESVLREGQEIVVQIAKEPIGSKGARITSNLSVPGRHLVLTPWARRVGVSRRIDSDRERRRLREIVERLRPKDLGFIIRTAGDGVREADLEADVRYLESIWKKIKDASEGSATPSVLHAEHDLPVRIIRDLANHETKRIVIDSKEAYDSIQEFVDQFVADPKPDIERYEGSSPIFDSLDLEAQIHANLGRKVWLKSGGSLVVDQSEALTAIDVNTGRFVGKRNLEETVFKTNLEAVKEVVNQLRFRNIGGLIIIDLIDMESQDHRDKVYRALKEALRADKARTNILKISELGLVEMTRKRTRENLVQTLCEPCAYCEGRGYVLSGQSVAYNILREIRNDLPRFCGRRIAVTVNPRVAEKLLGSEAKPLAALSDELGRDIEVRARPGLHQEQFEVEALDQGEPVVIPLRWLRDPAEIAAEEEAEAKEHARGKREKAEAAKNGGKRGTGSERKRTRATSKSSEDAETEPETKPDAAPEAKQIEPASLEDEAIAAGIYARLDEKIAAGSGAAEVVGEAQSTLDAPSEEKASDEEAVANAALGTPETADEALAEPSGAESEAAPDAPIAAQPLDDEAESRILPRSEEVSTPESGTDPPLESEQASDVLESDASQPDTSQQTPKQQSTSDEDESCTP